MIWPYFEEEYITFPTYEKRDFVKEKLSRNPRGPAPRHVTTFISTPSKYDNPFKVMWEEAVPTTDICNCYVNLSNYELIWRKEEMKLRKVSKDLEEYTLCKDRQVDIRDCKITVKKVADGLTLRVAAAAVSSYGAVYADLDRIYTLQADGCSYGISYGRYVGDRKNRQEAVDYVMAKVVDDYTKLLDIKLQQVEDAAYLNQLADKE